MGAFISWGSNTLTFDVTTLESHPGMADVTEHPVEDGANIADHVRQNLDQLHLEVFISNAPITAGDRSGAIQTVDLDVPAKQVSALPSLPTVLTAKQWHNPLPLVGFAADEPFSPDVGLKETNKNPGGKAQILQFDSPFDAVNEALETLRKLQSDVQILTVFTSERVYENVILEKFELTRNADTGTGATLTLDFKQLRTVAVKFTTAPKPTMPRAFAKISKGTKGTTDATNADQKKSLLKLLLGSFLGGPSAGG